VTEIITKLTWTICCTRGKQFWISFGSVTYWEDVLQISKHVKDFMW